MVLNFFQLINHTDHTFNIVNSENSGDDYTVGPNVTDVRRDLWLAMGDGSKGATVTTYREGLMRLLLQMWDSDWAIRYRVGNKEDKILVDGSKNLWLEVYVDKIEFRCREGAFSGNESVRTITDWQSAI